MQTPSLLSNRPTPECDTRGVRSSTLALGSLEPLRAVLCDQALLVLPAGADVVVLPTAAAFTGAPQSALAIAEVLDALDVRVQALMVTDRASSAATYFGERLALADLVVLGDGSPLHARSVWRTTVVGDGVDAPGADD